MKVDGTTLRHLETVSAALGNELVEMLSGVSCLGRSAHPHTSWHAELVDAYVVAARDPEVELGGWLRNGCPMGIARGVKASNIFPEAPGSEA